MNNTLLFNKLSNAAVLILPYLTPKELATVSQTCKTLNLITKSITAVRSSDASRTFEKHPIPFINTIDEHPYAYFLYTPSQVLILPENPNRQPWGSGFDGKLDLGIFHPPVFINGSELVLDNGSGSANVGRKSVVVKLKIVRCLEKGWGLFADEDIGCGEFVCEYAGELLTKIEARRRQQKYDKLAASSKHTTSLLVVREHLPSGNACMRINIDATRIGNVARFINHSCDGGNLSIELVRSSGDLLPRVYFFTSRGILKDEELTFSYGDASLNPNGSKCLCGSSCCSGIMPSEQT
uniref:histone-lysine N-methyltransferase SUVR3 n=1 Tax=Erigeron canadensis TaxID=72917 RepID=UPI001CB8F8DF|nr:histone-lysine N-methyltransferase SUVR3 [Erigeron canadensis]